MNFNWHHVETVIKNFEKKYRFFHNFLSKQWNTIDFTLILAKKRYIENSEHIKLILAESIMILPLSRENSVIYRYFREKRSQIPPKFSIFKFSFV